MRSQALRHRIGLAVRHDIVDLGQLDFARSVAWCSRAAVALSASDRDDVPSAQFSLNQTETWLMAIHKQILEWQAAHPNITWIGWAIVWAIVLSLFFWPSRGLN
jgi:hypothetical protein